jgi:hypothetical protein
MAAFGFSWHLTDRQSACHASAPVHAAVFPPNAVNQDRTLCVQQQQHASCLCVHFASFAVAAAAAAAAAAAEHLH